MPSEFVTSVILGIVVFGGLAFQDTIVVRLAEISRENERTEFEEID